MSQKALSKILLSDYLKARGTATVLTYRECTVFGIPYPLEQGWIRKYKSLEITPAMLEALWKYSEGKDSGPVNRTRAALIAIEAVAEKPRLEMPPPNNSVSLEKSASFSLIRLNVPYAEKDEAKALGARWDPKGRFWYVPQGQVATQFERWLPDAGAYMQPSGNVQSNANIALPKKQTVDLFGPNDLIVGKTLVGSKYFDTGHDCIPWLPCEQCEAAVNAHAYQRGAQDSTGLAGC
jgi:hypothetical protein